MVVLGVAAEVAQITGFSLRDAGTLVHSIIPGQAPRTSRQPSQSPSSTPSPPATPTVDPTPTESPQRAGGLPTSPPGPSTTAQIEPGVTITITKIEPSPIVGYTLVDLAINNEKPNGTPYSLNFAAGDVVVYDDQNQSYPVNSVQSGNASIPQGQTFTNTNIEVRGHPAASAKSWTVAFKSLAGRANVTVIYTF